MFINKITAVTKPMFKGYEHVINDFGDSVYRFNYPYDDQNEVCTLQFFRLIPTKNYEYKLLETPILEKRLQNDGIEVNLQEEAGFKKNEPFAYRVVRKNNTTGEIKYIGADTGVTISSTGNGNKVNFWLEAGNKNDQTYTFVDTKVTRPRIQGAGYQVYPDSQKVGVKYRDFDHERTGEIYTDKQERAYMEGVVRTFSNKTGGNLAGLEENIDYLVENGYVIQPANPIAGSDNKFSHHYANKNNFQISDDMGNIENFASYQRKMFQNGKVYIHDSTFTSEGLEGIHFQYALRWAAHDPQTYYWFKMQGLKNKPLGFGVIPKNEENLRYKVVNPPVVYDPESKSIVKNLNYDSTKETFFQIYDGSQVTDEQISALDKSIDTYKKLKSGNPLAITSHDDTIANYIFEVNPNEYAERLQLVIELSKDNLDDFVLNSPQSTILMAQFSNFRLIRKTEGGFAAWDANTDLAKMNYFNTPYDEKILMSITDPTEREAVKKNYLRGMYEVQDMVLQNAKYWINFVKDVQNLYVAQVLKGAKSFEKIKEMVQNRLLPEEALLSKVAIENVLNGSYNLEPKGIMSSKDITLKALMSLPLETLEFDEKTVGVLATSYFTNRAINKETLGLSRFELMKKNNPHLVKPYAKVYSEVNALYSDDLKRFADEIIKKVDENATEKLLDEDGNYTEYGEYVVELMASSITKYAFLKSLVGKNLKTKILPNGEITYDYKDIKENTSLRRLGIYGYSPTDEAQQLLEKIKSGIRKLDVSDIDYLAQSISSRIKGTNVNSFRLAEAMVEKASRGMGIRIDALKDLADQDGGRNREIAFDDNQVSLISFLKRFVQVVKQESESSLVQAELTNVNSVQNDTLGDCANTYEYMPNVGLKFRDTPEAVLKLFNETGITTEAGYEYFFSTVMELFGANFETGKIENNNSSRCNAVIKSLEKLVNTRSADYIRNLLTFVDNHDKPRMLHGFALDMQLFHGGFDIYDLEGNRNYGKKQNNRINAMIQLANADDFASLPLEAKLNFDNPEYFRTVSSYSVAMGQLIRFAINDTLQDKVSEEEMKYLKLALVDLVNGNFKGNGQTTKIPSVNIKQLESTEAALTDILTRANILLPSHEFEAIINRTKDFNLVQQFTVRGDYDWNDEIANRNKGIAITVLRGGDENSEIRENDFMKYSTYSMGVAGLLRQAFIDVKGHDANARYRFLNAAKEFAQYYTRDVVESNRTKLPTKESYKAAMTKNKFATLDIRTAVEMVFEQAKYLSEQDSNSSKNELFKNSEEMVLNVWQNATEPAAQKMIMAMSLLCAMVGIPVLFAGDELVLSGYDEKTKNIYLPRNPLWWSETEAGIFKDYIVKVQKQINGTMKVRSQEKVSPLNHGTPYLMSTPDPNIPAFMMQDAYGNMTISVFNYEGVNPSFRYDYFKAFNIIDSNKEQIFKENNIKSININNRYVPILGKKMIDYIEFGPGIALPENLEFVNVNGQDDKTIYVTKYINNLAKTVLCKKNGGKIVLDGITAPNGSMILSCLKNRARRVHFLGNTRKYNIVSNPYQKIETPVEGEKLSLVSK